MKIGGGSALRKGATRPKIRKVAHRAVESAFVRADGIMEESLVSLPGEAIRRR